jgi:hypothetical protein
VSAAIPPPSWPLVSTDKQVHEGHITPPWYNYFKSADDAWRYPITKLTTVHAATVLIPNHGLAQLDPGTGATTYMIEDPEPGSRVTLYVGAVSTSCTVVTRTTDITFVSSAATGWRLNFTSTAGLFRVIELVAWTTSQYLIVSNPGSVVVST